MNATHLVRPSRDGFIPAQALKRIPSKRLHGGCTKAMTILEHPHLVDNPLIFLRILGEPAGTRTQDPVIKSFIRAIRQALGRARFPRNHRLKPQKYLAFLWTS